MSTYIAFLRAINVGGHNVKMETLRALFEELGFAHVATYIASGNVIFESPATDAQALTRTIEQHLQAALGYPVATFLRTAAEVAALAAYAPFPAAEMAAAGLYIAFLHELPPDVVQARVLALQTPTDLLHFHGRELYWLCRTKMSESSLFAKSSLEKTLGVPATVRNSTTVRKLAAKVG